MVVTERPFTPQVEVVFVPVALDIELKTKAAVKAVDEPVATNPGLLKETTLFVTVMFEPATGVEVVI